jgi:hypothetical protein
MRNGRTAVLAIKYSFNGYVHSCERIASWRQIATLFEDWHRITQLHFYATPAALSFALYLRARPSCARRDGPQFAFAALASDICSRWSSSLMSIFDLVLKRGLDLSRRHEDAGEGSVIGHCSRAEPERRHLSTMVRTVCHPSLWGGRIRTAPSSLGPKSVSWRGVIRRWVRVPARSGSSLRGAKRRNGPVARCRGFGWLPPGSPGVARTRGRM